MRQYSFSCYDQDEQKTTTIEFSDENDAWSGSSGPLYNFFNFLKGCGYLFNVDDNIGIMRENGTFIDAFDGESISFIGEENE